MTGHPSSKPDPNPNPIICKPNVRTARDPHRTVVGARSMKGRRSTNRRGAASVASLAATLPVKLPPPPPSGGVAYPPALPLGGVPGTLMPSSSPGMVARSRLHIVSGGLEVTCCKGFSVKGLGSHHVHLDSMQPGGEHHYLANMSASQKCC